MGKVPSQSRIVGGRWILKNKRSDSMFIWKEGFQSPIRGSKTRADKGTLELPYIGGFLKLLYPVWH